MQLSIFKISEYILICTGTYELFFTSNDHSARLSWSTHYTLTYFWSFFCDKIGLTYEYIWNLSQSVQNNKHDMKGKHKASVHRSCMPYTVWCGYNKVNFLPYSQKLHPIACPLGWGMECILWIRTVIYTLPQALQWCMQYHVTLDWVLTVFAENNVHGKFILFNVEFKVWWLIISTWDIDESGTYIWMSDYIL